MGKTAEFFGGFLHLKMQNYIIKLYFVFAFEGGFCSTLNESAPYGYYLSPLAMLAAVRVFLRSIVIVIGPTPPGTGVI